ncbi:MAG: cupin domain-containing protein, partial [Rhodobacteraceae bacterium]|nr:cupin domain-containing protein [Paracoccaceae bacterium]
MHDPIRIGQLTIRFLIDRSDSKDSMALFELTVPPGAKVPAPHYHSNWDEAVYGLEGSMTWTLSGTATELAPGGHLFIPRGAVHHFINRSEAPARALVMIAPGV